MKGKCLGASVRPVMHGPMYRLFVLTVFLCVFVAPIMPGCPTRRILQQRCGTGKAAAWARQKVYEHAKQHQGLKFGLGKANGVSRGALGSVGHANWGSYYPMLALVDALLSLSAKTGAVPGTGGLLHAGAVKLDATSALAIGLKSDRFYRVVVLASTASVAQDKVDLTDGCPDLIPVGGDGQACRAAVKQEVVAHPGADKSASPATAANIATQAYSRRIGGQQLASILGDTQVMNEYGKLGLDPDLL